MKTAFFLFGLFGLIAAQVAVSVTNQVSNSGSVAFNLGGGSFGPIAAVLPSFSVSSNASSSVTLSLSVNTLFGLTSILNKATVNFAGGLAINSDQSSNGVNIFANAGFSTNIVSSLLNLFGSIGQTISLSISSNNPVQLTLTGTTGNLAASGNLQVGLFTSYTDGTNSGSATVYGSVPYSIQSDGKTYTYTVNVPGGNTAVNLFFKPFDATQAKSSNAGATASSSGSGSFSTAGFIPVVLGYDQVLTGGLQYAFGNNLQVTPSASSGAQGTLNVQNVGAFSNAISVTGNSGNSAAPAASNGGFFFNNYYQISGSGSGNNVLQWSTSPSDTTWNSLSFTNASASVNGAVTATPTTGAVLAAQAQAKGQTFSWYKSSTSAGASAAASAWTRVSSTSSATASGGIKVYATVNSYSQWTVASGDGNAVKATFVTLIVALLVILF